MKQIQNKVNQSQTDIRSKNSHSQTNKPKPIDRYFIKLGSKNRKQIAIHPLNSMNNIVSCMSIKDQTQSDAVIDNTQSQIKKAALIHDLNYVYQQLEFDPLKKDQYCTDKCTIY